MPVADDTPSHVALPDVPDEIAPDGSQVRVLVGASAGSMAHFRLEAGKISIPQRHRTVTELWYVIAGSGRMWRLGPGGQESELELAPGISLSIPVGTGFQFRSAGPGPLDVVAVTMPPWPGAGEAETVLGAWQPSVGMRSG